MRIELHGKIVVHMSDGRLTAKNATASIKEDVITIRAVGNEFEPPSPFISARVSGSTVIITGRPNAIIMEDTLQVDLPFKNVSELTQVYLCGEGAFFMHPYHDILFDTIHVHVQGRGKVDLGDNLFRKLSAIALEGGSVEDARAGDISLTNSMNGEFNNIKTLDPDGSRALAPPPIGIHVYYLQHRSVEEWHEKTKPRCLKDAQTLSAK